MKKPKIKRNHSIGMPLVRVIPSLTMMTWNREAMKAFHGQTRDLVCHNLGNGRIILRSAAMEDLAKKIKRDREAPEFTLRLVVNRNRAISRTPKTIQTFLRDKHVHGGPFVGKAIRNYAALYVNFNEPASGEDISIGDILESAPVVKFPKAVEEAKESKPRKVKKAKKAKAVKKEAPVARKPKTEKPVAKKVKAAKPAPPAKKVVTEEAPKKPAPKSRATINDDDEPEIGDDDEATPIGEAEDDEPPAGEADESWDGSVEEVADEEGDDDDVATEKLPSPVRASRTSGE